MNEVKKMLKKREELRLVKSKTYQGYYLKNIKGFLGSYYYMKFNNWFSGQTGVIHKGELLVYKWDFDKFCNQIGLAIGKGVRK
jgi:hypothetical protein